MINSQGGINMANIRPSSDLRNHYNEISDFCNNTHEPVYITKKGKGDLVVLSNTDYEKLCAKSELVKLVFEGYEDYKNKNSRPADEVFADLERKYKIERI